MSEPRIESSEILYQGWGTYLLATVRFADGSVRRHQIDDHGSAVCVLPYDPERKIAILVKQMRPNVLFAGGDPNLLEVPGGIIETDDIEACGRRELLEEAGIKAESLEHLVTVWATPGVSTEAMHLYAAPFTPANRVSAGGGLAHEGEDLSVIELPLSDLARMADAGELPDLKTFATIQTLRLRKPDLFA
jgi:nudix-type nucleoside diphosphatase (YffH/AdpP family)